jgi:hypothetical protein
MVLICAWLIYAPAMMAADTTPVVGTVAESMESGGYVYLKLKEQGIWIAANAFAVSEGDQIQYSGSMEMKDFHSTSLDRTFESILFVQNASLVGKDGAAINATTMEGQGSKNVQISKSVSVQAPVAGEIATLTDGKTISNIFAESARLKEQIVSLNARVIKISKNILGKNWITLQDGTGTEPDNKLLATSLELVSPGDTVIARGVVRTDVDLGYGYQYKVLLEEVTFSAGLE